jgi:two-component system, chemotaxis family, sensor kinase CheA
MTLPDAAAWVVEFFPATTGFRQGEDPLRLIRRLEDQGGAIEKVDLGALPALRDLDPEQCYFGWTIRLPGGVPESTILACLDAAAQPGRARLHPHSKGA